MRVLQVHTFYRQMGGEDSVVAAERDLLTARGHDVELTAATNPPGTLQAARAQISAPWNRRAARDLRRAVESFRPDVAHVHNTWYAMSPSVVTALSALDVPVVMTLHNYRLACPGALLYHHGARHHGCLDGNPWQAVGHRCYRDSALLSAVAAATVTAWRRSGSVGEVDRFICFTESGRSLYERAGLPADRLVVRPHGLADPGPRTTPPSDGDDVLFVGRAVEEKGLGQLLDWWNAAPRPLGLTVLGDGPALADWRAAPPAGVTLRGAVPREAVLDAMRRSRALLVPSLWDEPYPMVAVEAMACGLGVVSTGVGGLRDIHGAQGGWLAPLDDDGVFDAAAWDRALWGPGGVVDDAACDARGAGARARYEARSTPEQAGASLEAVYADAVTARAARRG